MCLFWLIICVLWGECMQPNFEVFKHRLLTAIGDEPLYAWAVRVGINKGSLNVIMARNSIPKAEMLVHMAFELGCTIDWLLGVADLGAPQGKPAAETISTQPIKRNSDLAGAIEAVNNAYARIKRLESTELVLTADEKTLISAFRSATEDRREIFMALAKPSRAKKKA
jgi:transcriptional regulator with XRE-family HTH domain